MKCKTCNSSKLFFYKYIWADNSYHYKYWCLDCNKKVGVPRDKYVYEKVKDIPWIPSSGILKEKYCMGKKSSKRYQKNLLEELYQEYGDYVQ